jgi:hypothetical protein
MTDLDALAEVLLAGPDLDGAEPSGEWGRTVALGYARRVLDAGWRPPIDVSPAAERATPPARESATPEPPAGETHNPEVPGE